ncbi:MAG TPA: hypothetical protein VG347_24275 [Verrucomicrobiae bacterium]|nr:hypothetical protein [Verrucomicrobiae bacterium]
MKLSRALIPASLLTSFSIAHGQQAAIQQLQNMQQQQLSMPQPELRTGTNAPELYTGENEDIGPQHVLRVGTSEAPRRRYFDGQLDTQIFYTDNANYSGSHERVSSWVFVNTVQAAFAPDPFNLGPGKFAPALGFSSQWYNYTDNRMSPLDFDAQTAFANLRYLLGYWQFGVGVNYTRLLSQDGYNSTYDEWLPNMDVQRIIPVTTATAFIIGDAMSYHFSEVPQLLLPTLPPSFAPARSDINDHFDNTAYVTFNWQPTAHLTVQPFYRFQYSNYKNATVPGSIRNDYLNAFGITLIYNFNQYISARAFYSYTTKSSDDALSPSYDEMNGGVGATLEIKF